MTTNLIQTLLDKGVNIPAPASIALIDILPEQIEPGATLWPGTTLEGPETYIGKGAQIGMGGGALVSNSQVGEGCRLMQGSYRDSTLLPGVETRGGAEIRDNCLLEENVSLGHTVGLKQTIFMTDVVAGSLINFCDALMCGGTSRRDHSEIGSCMALYNFTPQGDKFASLFGRVPEGVFLNARPIFIGGQTKIISPVTVGFGCVVAAGAKLSHSIPDGTLTTGESASCHDVPFCRDIIRRPAPKILASLFYIHNLMALDTWYNRVRVPSLGATPRYSILLPAAIGRIQAALRERHKRLAAFIEKIKLAAAQNAAEEYKEALSIPINPAPRFDFQLLDRIAKKLSADSVVPYPEAVRRLPAILRTPAWATFETP